MARNPGQKSKLLHLMDIFTRQSDEEHPLTLQQIIQMLAVRGIAAERKSLYGDMEALRQFGMDIVKVGSRNAAYYLGSRSFELPELKLLVDAIQGSRFITARKSAQLIGKLEALASTHQASALGRQVFVANRVKTMNESIYYNIDGIHQAISQNRQISFQYFEWAVEFGGRGSFERRFRRQGQRYQVSPWALTWGDENYYLVAFESQSQSIRHYRVDKMAAIRVGDALRDGQSQFERFDMALYARGMFGMYGGRTARVQIRFDNRLAGVVADRFGRDIHIEYQDEGHFCIFVDVAISPLFYSWVFGFGPEAKLLGPDWVVEEFKTQLARGVGEYQL